MNVIAPRARGALAGAATVLCLAAAAPDPERPRFERRIDVPQPGRVTVALDRDVYENARADLGDLRIVDDQDRPNHRPARYSEKCVRPILSGSTPGRSTSTWPMNI